MAQGPRTRVGPEHAGAAGWPAREPDCADSARVHFSVPFGPDAARFRPEPGRQAGDLGAGPCRANRDAAPRGRCWRTASCARGRSAWPRRPTAIPWPGTAWSAGSRASRSTVSATPRSRVGPASSVPKTSARSCCTRTWSAPAGSSAPTRCLTACMRTWSGGCAAISWTSRPTVPSATSVWAGPATYRYSPPPPATSTTQAASCSRGLSTWRSNRAKPAALCPKSFQTP